MVSSESVKGSRYNFSADISKLMGLIVNTFYSNREVFLRELISNSSDSIDKLKFLSLTDSEVLKDDDTDFKIEIIPNPEEKTLTVRDNGIGMTKDDLIKNLGTIATSGTKTFMDAIEAGADIQMIGQFGVGFYSVFLVSDRVQVRSKHNDDKQHVWESTAGGEFDVFDDSENQHQLKRGTEIVMHLKEDQLEYLEERRLKDVVKQHSEFVAPKILLWVSKEVEKDVTDDEAEEEAAEKTEEKKDTPAEEDDSKVKIEEVEDDGEKGGEDADKEPKKKTKKVKQIEEDFEQLNKNTAIWARKKEDVNAEEYNAFYKQIANDWEDPLAYKHFHIEGSVEFKGIVFIPKRAPFDLFDSKKKPNNIRLYVRKVFINDEAKELCPEYLSFVKGVVDSEEMPLNISRETLQQNKLMSLIKKNIMKKTLELIEEISEDKEKFDSFYKNFGKNLKYGVHEDADNRAKLAGFLRFCTTRSEKEPKTLKDYVEGMRPDQKDIYYITGESMEVVSRLPFLERLRKKDLEVLYMTDPIDEYFVQQLREFDGKNLVSVTKEGLELPQSDEEKKALEEQKKAFEPFCKRAKEVLGNRVERVEVSDRMTASPCSISTGRYGWSSRMEQIMKNQALRDTTYSSHMAAKKILEVNPSNAIVAEMARRLKEDANDPVSKNLVFLLYETALLTSAGLTLSNPMEYAERIFKLTRLGLNIVEEGEGEEVPDLEPVEGEEGADKSSPMEEVD